MLFERDQAGISEIRAPHVEFFEAVCLCLLDRIPEQQSCSPKIAKTAVAAAILVNQTLLSGESEYARYCCISLEGDPDLGVVSHRRPEFETTSKAEEAGLAASES